MKLQKVRIRNFRGIIDLELELDDTIILIGENNTGKTTVLDALKYGLGRSYTRKTSPFYEFDYHLPSKESQPSEAPEISITLEFKEDQVEEWDEEIIQSFPEIVQIDDEELQSVILKITSKYDTDTERFISNYDFYNLENDVLTKGKNPRNLINLQQYNPVFYLAALRDSAQEFKPRSQFWGPFVRSLKIDPDERAELESKLEQLNEQVLSTHDAFDTVKERLRETAKYVPLGTESPVSIEAIPGKVFDMLSRTQIMLQSKTGAKLPIGRHGEGTQSLTVMCLFDAFLQSQLNEVYTEHSQPILALEEPEAHLHPSAIRAIGKMLTNLPGQKVIATHSGELLADIPLRYIRRLRRVNGKIEVFRINEADFNDAEIGKLDYQIRAMRGSLLFARCWLLVEGQTDFIVLSECSRILGNDLFTNGVSIIEYSQVGIEVLIKFAKALGIEWIMLADKDSAGDDYVSSASSQLDSTSETYRINQLSYGTMELDLCINGFGNMYDNEVPQQKRYLVNASPETNEYWSQVVGTLPRKKKTRLAHSVVNYINNNGIEYIPDFICKLIDNTITIAEDAS